MSHRSPKAVLARVLAAGRRAAVPTVTEPISVATVSSTVVTAAERHRSQGTAPRSKNKKTKP